MAKYVFDTNEKQEAGLALKVAEINDQIQGQDPDRPLITKEKLIENTFNNMTNFLAEAPLIKKYESKRVQYVKAGKGKRDRIDRELDT